MNGSIRRRSKNSWELSMDLGRDPEGKRKRKFVNIKGTKGQAQQKLRELLTTLDKGMPLDSSKATLGEFLDFWLKNYAEIKLNCEAMLEILAGMIDELNAEEFLGACGFVKALEQEARFPVE